MGDLDAHMQLEAILDRLRSHERDALLLRFVQGCSLAEIGRLQGTSEDAARMRIERAIKRVQSWLGTGANLSILLPNLVRAPSQELMEALHLSPSLSPEPHVLHLAKGSQLTMPIIAKVSIAAISGLSLFCTAHVLGISHGAPLAPVNQPKFQSPADAPKNRGQLFYEILFYKDGKLSSARISRTLPDVAVKSQVHIGQQSTLNLTMTPSPSKEAGVMTNGKIDWGAGSHTWAQKARFGQAIVLSLTMGKTGVIGFLLQPPGMGSMSKASLASWLEITLTDKLPRLPSVPVTAQSAGPRSFVYQIRVTRDGKALADKIVIRDVEKLDAKFEVPGSNMGAFWLTPEMRADGSIRNKIGFALTSPSPTALFFMTSMPDKVIRLCFKPHTEPVTFHEPAEPGDVVVEITTSLSEQDSQ